MDGHIDNSLHGRHLDLEAVAANSIESGYFERVADSRLSDWGYYGHCCGRRLLVD